MFLAFAVFPQFIFLLDLKEEVCTVVIEHRLIPAVKKIGIAIEIALYVVRFICQNLKRIIDIVQRISGSFKKRLTVGI